jgi:hypothetical protein
MNQAADWVRSQRKAYFFEGWQQNPPKRIWVPPWLWTALREYKNEMRDDFRGDEIVLDGDAMTFRGIRVVPAWTEE